MKTLNLIFKFIFVILIATLFFNQSFASSTPPDPPAGDHGGSSDLPPGGDAPIGGGMFILIGIGMAYASKKLYAIKKIDLEE
jgi:hypothetical protein